MKPLYELAIKVSRYGNFLKACKSKAIIELEDTKYLFNENKGNEYSIQFFRGLEEYRYNKDKKILLLGVLKQSKIKSELNFKSFNPVHSLPFSYELSSYKPLIESRYTGYWSVETYLDDIEYVKTSKLKKLSKDSMELIGKSFHEELFNKLHEENALKNKMKKFENEKQEIINQCDNICLLK